MGNGKSKAIEVFEKFDHEGSGVLTLDEILSIRALPGFNHPVTNSPLLLFQFDSSKSGTLTKEDFIKLVKYLAHLEKRRRSDNEISTHVHAHHIDLDKVPGLTDRDCPTPAIAGNIADSDNSKGDSSDSDEQLEQGTKEALNKFLSAPKSRDKFVTWLFKFADTKHNKQIEESEMQNLLKALEYDGINPDDLVHGADNAPGKKTPSTYAKKIIEEYGNGSTRVLTKEQFMLLADLILKHYEIRSAGSASDRVGKYELKQKLGEGSQAVVRVAIDTETGTRKAVKIVSKGNVADMSRLDVEIKAMKLLRHPHVITLEEVMETAEHVFFVMELCPGGNLADHVAIEPLSNDTSRHFFRQLVDCVSYCHANGVCHRDLKLENIVLDFRGENIKVCDFGHAGIFSKGWDVFSTGMLGSLFHISPEQITGQCYSGEKVDIWAMGVVLFRMLVGKPPFYDEVAKNIVDLIQKAEYTVPSHLDPLLRDLFARIFVLDPKQRATTDDILRHPWITSAKPKKLHRLFVGKLMLEPTTRTPAAWALLHDSFATIGVHSIQAKNDPSTLRCAYVQKELKFESKLHSASERHPPYFEFTLVAGSGLELRRLVLKIKESFAVELDKFHQRKLAQKSPSQPQLDTAVLVQTAKQIAQHFKLLFNQLLQNKATILLTGKTGVGKSSVANKVFGWQLAEVGRGVAVTTRFSSYTLPWKPFVLYDTKGFEINTINDFLDELQKFFVEHQTKDCIHVVWYVVDASCARFEPFEIEFCRETAKQFPLLILVNKADLCSPKDLQSLCATIEGMKFENCHGVIPVVAERKPTATLETVPDKCSKCGSEDVSVRKARNIWMCNNCGYSSTLQASTWTQDDGFQKVVDISQTLVPESVRMSFIATQKVSRQAKLNESKKLIRSFHKQLKKDSTSHRSETVLDMLTKLCLTWDIASSDGGGIAQQMLCLLPRKTKKPRSKAGDMSSEPPSASDISKKTLKDKGKSQSELKSSSTMSDSSDEKNGKNKKPDAEKKKRRRLSRTQSMFEGADIAVASSTQPTSAPSSPVPSRPTSVSSAAPVSSNTGSSSSSSSDEEDKKKKKKRHRHNSKSGKRTEEIEDGVADDEAAEEQDLEPPVRESFDILRESLSKEIMRTKSPGAIIDDPELGNVGWATEFFGRLMKLLRITPQQQATDSTETAASSNQDSDSESIEEFDLNHTTALIIAWVACLQRLHLLLAEQSFGQAESEHYVQKCVDTAFSDFREEVLSDYCGLLREHQLDSVMDAVLEPRGL